MTHPIEDPTPEGTYYGIPVAPLGEDGDTLLALGHHDPRRVLAAFNRYARTVCGWPNLADDYSATLTEWAGRIEHKRAVFRTPDPLSQWEDPDCTWIADWSDPTAPGARPVTLLEVA